LLRAFADDRILQRASHELDLHGYRTHEFGDSVMVEAASGLSSSPERGLTVTRMQSVLYVHQD
jgi:S-adenosylmethionine:tRNA ribosyltransferase-isomerase